MRLKSVTCVQLTSDARPLNARAPGWSARGPSQHAHGRPRGRHWHGARLLRDAPLLRARGAPQLFCVRRVP